MLVLGTTVSADQRPLENRAGRHRCLSSNARHRIHPPDIAQSSRIAPQWGQITPSGQRRRRMYSRRPSVAAVPLVHLLERARIITPRNGDALRFPSPTMSPERGGMKGIPTLNRRRLLALAAAAAAMPMLGHSLRPGLRRGAQWDLRFPAWASCGGALPRPPECRLARPKINQSIISNANWPTAPAQWFAAEPRGSRLRREGGCRNARTVRGRRPRPGKRAAPPPGGPRIASPPDADSCRRAN